VLKLYRYKNSICTQKVLITLDEKKLPFETQDVNLFLNEQYSPEYLKINPKGVVPSLDHDGRIVIESTLICEYLDETFNDALLIPDDPYRRSQMRLWAKAIDEGIFEATREISFSAMFRERLRNMTEEQRQERFRNVGDPERTDRYKSVYEHGVDSHYVEEGIAAYEKLFKNMDAALADGRTWLDGVDFTLGDIALVPYFARLDYLCLLDIWLEDRPKVMAWFDRARARPSFTAAIDGAISDEEKEAMQTHGSKLRDAIREKRDAYLAN